MSTQNPQTPALAGEPVEPAKTRLTWEELALLTVVVSSELRSYQTSPGQNLAIELQALLDKLVLMFREANPARQ